MTENLRSKLFKEQDKLPWKELARHHAFGRLVLVKGKLDLLDVAEAMAADNTPKIRSWMEEEVFGTPSDQEAKDFAIDPNKEFVVNIISPFVIAKESLS